ncbi:type I restriction endonuclease [Mesorhizobium sp. SP-1A]|uniref:type I restriction endonuclease n=1 Tax=Mesorhizobium sp. SP-1A TaxID=3077840 RepID=UPI0028F72666|nr:type I restriction endonuclease [Mesorhizobium sp. SP-1A]
MSYNLNEIEDEAGIQRMLQSFLETEKFGPILEELVLNRYPELQKHHLILVDDFIDQVSVLNSSLWTSGRYQESKEEIIDLIWQHFRKCHDDATNNAEIYDLIFAGDKRTITLTSKDSGKPRVVEYRVVDTDYQTGCRNNVVKVIKEKVIRLHRNSDQVQRPDFAIYLNGIPLIIIEVKNPLASGGLIDAIEDYRNKRTYHKFMSCLCTDGTNAGLVSNLNATTVDRWRSYGNHLRQRPEGQESGFFDFAEEILFNIRNLVFFFQFGLFKVPSGLGNLRVQQYYVMKNAVRILENAEDNEDFREVVKQPPRSGKTIAIRSLINAITNRFPSRFDKIFIQVPDLTIYQQFIKEFGNFPFSHGFKLKVVNRRWKSSADEKDGVVVDASDVISYEEAVTGRTKAIYVMNMQKISEDMSSLRDYDSRILVFIDEVHTHQLGINANVRENNFPNASYITFTATTRKQEQKDRTVDLTLTEYSTSQEGYLDELFNEDARNLNMVVPVVYEKERYNVVFSEENARRFSNHVEAELKSMIEIDPKFEGILTEIEKAVDEYAKELLKAEDGIIQQAVFDFVVDSDHLDWRNHPEIADKAEERRFELIDEKSNGFIRRIKTEFHNRQKLQSIPDVVRHIIRDFKAKIDENYSFTNEVSGERERRFKPKAFLVVDDQNMANAIGEYIFDVTNGNCTLDSMKFGIDYSENMKFNDDNQSFLEKFNVVKYGNSIKDDFDSQESDSTDILIIVGKYMMGYDNKQLCSVYCFTQFKEPSRIFQLYTRPGTKVEHKKVGFFVDLSFTDDNYDAYKKALEWYESGKESAVLFLTPNEVERQQRILGSLIDELCKLLGTTRDGLLSKGNERNLFIKNVTKDQQDAALKICTKINTTVKNLLSPRYYQKYIGYLLAISKGFLSLISYLKASSKTTVFTNKDIAILLNDFLDNLHLKIDDLMSIELVNGKLVKQSYIKPTLQTKITKKIHNVRDLLTSFAPFGTSDLFQGLKRIADDIEASSQWDDETDQQTTQLEADTQKAMEALKHRINNDFDGRTDWFIVHSIVRNFCLAASIPVSGDHQVGFKQFTAEIANLISGHLASNWRGGLLTIDQNDLNDLRRKLPQICSKIQKANEQDKKVISAIYKATAVDNAKEAAEDLLRNLLEQVHKKQNEFTKHFGNRSAHQIAV